MFMPGKAPHFPIWLALLFVSGLPRILAAFLLPNAFGDAYAYIRDVGVMREKLSAGTFQLTDLYGFWLPLYQFICAVVSAVVGHPFYVSKLISALFGTGICLLVYDISLRLTVHRNASLLAFALIALNPLHIFNSASAMTDVPHAFFVLACVSFILRRRFVLSALMVALAGLTRVDSWMIIPLIPALQFLEERRVSPAAVALMLLPPLFWFYVSWKATGDWLACFKAREQYMDWLLAANPILASFSLNGIARDAGALLLSIDLAVLVACFAGVWLAIKRMRFPAPEHTSETLRHLLAVNVFFFAFLGFIVFAYLTHKQPIIFPRYGLIMFALGLPVLPWTYLNITERKPEWSRKLLLSIICVCLLSASLQLAYSVGYINRERAHGEIAEYLRAHFKPETRTRIFSDEGTALALSGIASESFLSSTYAPHHREGFVNFLRENNVEYLVFVEQPGSILPELFPELKDGAGNEMFRPVRHARSRFLPANIWLYRIYLE